MSRPDATAHQAHVQRIADAAVAAAEPGRLVRSRLRHDGILVDAAGAALDLSRGAAFLVAVGKASVPMAAAASAELGGRLAGGVVISKEAPQQLPAPLVYYQGSHPIPSQKSVDAAQAALAMARRAQEGDLVICLISGGTSALLTAPLVSLPAWRQLNEALIQAGCDIDEVNTVRRRFDAVKGGGLARAIAPARTISLILSDVIGNRLASIGSGPTVPESPNDEAVRAVLQTYEILERLTPAARAEVVGQLSKPPEEEPKYAAILNEIIGDVRLAASGAQEAATALGFATEIVATDVQGEARVVGRSLASKARELPPGACLLYGGETTVRVTGHGFGGRNQEMALAAALALDGTPGVVAGFFSTDGDDGVHPPDGKRVAGAFVTGSTASLGRKRGMDPEAFLARNDSYGFFDALPGHHVRLNAGTNVNDLAVLLRYA
jgi:hydroxypyruvate reductase